MIADIIRPSNCTIQIQCPVTVTVATGIGTNFLNGSPIDFSDLYKTGSTPAPVGTLLNNGTLGKVYCSVLNLYSASGIARSWKNSVVLDKIPCFIDADGKNPVLTFEGLAAGWYQVVGWFELDVSSVPILEFYNFGKLQIKDPDCGPLN